jgi:2-polyprenyl-3-methyl-5-hydroxy-6-metoxy-1,4-benzoquinol methylase
MSTFTSESAAGERFAFGKNWRSYLNTIDDERIAEASRSLSSMLRRDSLESATFVDVGCGSGLFSLAAARLGADRIHSLDFDPDSVDCARTLRERYGISPERWTVGEGSVLDAEYLDALGTFNIVYSWGVLHHTGDMETALGNVARLVAPGGALYIAIYNDQGFRSRIWLVIKRIYNRLPPSLRGAYTVMVMGPRELMNFAASIVRRRPGRYLRSWTHYQNARGMSRVHDLVDWVGGYPFEVATPERIFDFYRDRGFKLRELTTCGGRLGCNQFLFTRSGFDV